MSSSRLVSSSSDIATGGVSSGLRQKRRLWPPFPDLAGR